MYDVGQRADLLCRLVCFMRDALAGSLRQNEVRFTAPRLPERPQQFDGEWSAARSTHPHNDPFPVVHLS